MRVACDWDGTAIEIDALAEIVRSFGDARIYEKTEASSAQLTLNEAIALEIGTVASPLSGVVEWLAQTVRVRPGFVDFARTYRPLIVSSGFHELIEPILQREGLELEVCANWLDTSAKGWRPRFRNAEPCFVCGEPCKRAGVEGMGDLAYVGDGFSDRCVALAASRVFARDGLARYLESRGAGFEPFDDFHGIARLLGGTVEASPRL